MSCRSVIDFDFIAMSRLNIGQSVAFPTIYVGLQGSQQSFTQHLKYSTSWLSRNYMYMMKLIKGPNLAKRAGPSHGQIGSTSR
eukprot:6106018-Pleurochrysis_carterae.AAC.3